MRIEDGVEALGNRDGSGILRVDVAHERVEAERLACPVAQCRRRLRCVALPFAAFVDEPAEFLFREQRAVIDADLPDTVTVARRSTISAPWPNSVQPATS